MKILYISQSFYPAVYGGGEYLIYLISKSLARKGHEVHVVTQNVRGEKEYENLENLRIHRVGPEFAGSSGSSIRSSLSFIYHTIRETKRLNKQQRLDNSLRNNNQPQFDVVHTMPYMGTICGYLCSHLFSIPHIATLNDVYQATDKNFWKAWMSDEVRAPAYVSFLANLVERICLKLSPRVIHTVSEISKEDLIAFGIDGARIHIVYPGLEASLYDGPSESTDVVEDNASSPYAVFIGRLVTYKNVSTLIKAFENVVQQIPQAKLLIVGDGPYKHELVKMSTNLQQSIHFLGNVPEHVKLELIRNSSMLVFPSLIEGFGIVIIEAFACKKPVLVSNIRPLSDIVKDGYTGYVIHPFDIGTWGDRMINIFSNITTQEAFGNNAYEEFRSKYQLEIAVSKIESLYMSNLS